MNTKSRTWNRSMLLKAMMDRKLSAKSAKTTLLTIGSIREKKGDEAAEEAAATAKHWMEKIESEEEILQKLDQL